MLRRDIGAEPLLPDLGVALPLGDDVDLMLTAN